MREYKFRGKRLDNGEWVYGSLICNVLFQIVYFDEDGCRVTHEVDPETVGQYTGLKDKNGKEIYEGDIIKADAFKPNNYQIKFIEGGFCLALGNLMPLDINTFYPSGGCMLEIIGNIYDNPELLEQK